MRATSLLTASLTLNVALGAVLMFNLPLRSTAARTSTAPTKLVEQRDPAKLFAWAKQYGADDDLAYGLALAAARAATVIAAPDEYWRPLPARSAALREADYKSVQAARKLLLQSFGPAAQAQPAFADVFQPYRQRFPFLSADKQMALQQILFETTAGGAAAFVGPEGAGDPRSARVRALLSDEEWAEYQRRESPAALRLANNGFEFTEAEFRAVYDVVAAAPPTAAGLSPHLASTSAVEQVLGTDRFLEFKRAQDPLYRWLRSGTARFGITQEVVADAYELIKSAEKQASQVGKTPRGAANIAQARAAIFAARDRELKARLGAEMFNYIAPRLESAGGHRANWPGNPATAFIPAP